MTQEEQHTEVDESTAVKEALQCEIGAKLQQAREAKHLTYEYILKELKFNKTFLEALESGEWHKMPGEVYALGFLKQYAQLLDVDVSQEVERIKNKNFELTTPLTYPDPPISPNKKWALAAVITFIVLMVAVNFSGTDETSVSPTADNMATAETSPMNNTQDIQASTTQTSINHDDVRAPVKEVTRNVPEGLQNTSPKNNEPPEATAEVTKKSYSFYAATDDVWLQVYEVVSDTESKLLREVLLKKGQSFSIIDTSATLMLTAGNPRALEILEGNQVLFAAGTLGEEGKILKRFRINP